MKLNFKHASVPKVATVVILATAIGASALLRAETDEARRARAGIVVETNRLAALDKIQSYHDLYRTIRESAHLEVRKDTDAWLKKTEEWVTGWYKLKILVSLSDQFSFETLDRQLKQDLQVQAQRYLELRDLGKKIKESAQRATTRMESLPDLDANSLADYAPQIEDIKNEYHRVLNELKSMTNLCDSRAQELDELSTQSSDMLLATFKLAIISKGIDVLESGVANAMRTLEAAKSITPKIIAFNKKGDQFAKHVQRKGIFHAMDLLEELDQQCDTLKSAIRQSGLPAAEISSKLGTIEDDCNSFRPRLQARLNGQTKATILDSYRRSKILEFEARYAADDLKINTELYRILARVSPEQLAQWEAAGDDHLKTYEMAWDQVDEGRF